MKLKHLAVSALAALTITTSAAALDIVPTAKGPHLLSIRAAADEAAKSGIDIVARQTGGCGEAVRTFHEATGPIGITWSTSAYRSSKRTGQNCVIDFNDATPVFVSWATYDFCVPTGTTLKPNSTVLLGTQKFMPQTSGMEHLQDNKMNIKFKNVLYPGSGAVAAALANGEVEAGVLATANAAKAVEAGSIECTHSTGSTAFGQKHLSELTNDDPFSSYSVGIGVWVRNMSDAQVAELKASLRNLPEILARSHLINGDVDITAEEQQAIIDSALQQLQWH